MEKRERNGGPEDIDPPATPHVRAVILSAAKNLLFDLHADVIIRFSGSKNCFLPVSIARTAIISAIECS